MVRVVLEQFAVDREGVWPPVPRESEFFRTLPELQYKLGGLHVCPPAFGVA